MGWSVSVLAGAVLMAIPIHSNFLLLLQQRRFSAYGSMLVLSSLAAPDWLLVPQQILHVTRQ